MSNNDTCPICGEPLQFVECGYSHEDYGGWQWHCATHDLNLTIYPEKWGPVFSDEED